MDPEFQDLVSQQEELGCVRRRLGTAAVKSDLKEGVSGAPIMV